MSSYDVVIIKINEGHILAQAPLFDRQENYGRLQQFGAAPQATLQLVQPQKKVQKIQ